jgi:4-amino-4-deoxy-L-arabinose transferase-like glycosyltransferase
VLLALVYYRRCWRVLLPLTVVVLFARLYAGADYPAAILLGAIVGGGYAVAGLLGCNALWQWAGPKWFPLWWQQLPSLLHPEKIADKPLVAGELGKVASLHQYWVRLGYVAIAVMLFTRLIYIASGTIDLSKDEAYQWVWSKHPALSYYSKPPMIAYAQWLSTTIWGDNAFGVRFFSPVIGALLGWLLLRWMARFVAGRTAFWLVLVLQATPLLAVGTTLLTIDPLLVLFWTLAMILGWRAAHADSTVWHWLGVGLAAGLAFLSKYSALYLVLCWALFFALWPPARRQLRRPGPWLALLVMLLSLVPVLIWNSQHGWITMTHVSENAQLRTAWKPTTRFFLEFVGAELGLLNPVFLVAAIWAMAGFWKQRAPGTDDNNSLARQPRRGLMIYLFCLGGPVFLGHALFSLRSQVQANWIAPAVVPMFCLMVIYWDERWRQGMRKVVDWLQAGLVFGFIAVAIMHDPGLVGAMVGRPLPSDLDPLRRVRAWKQTAAVVEAARDQLRAEGKPVFVIAHHYGVTGLLSFYLPGAKPTAGQPPLVYALLGAVPENQFYFWPEYRYQNFRAGQNAIFVVEVGRPRYSIKGWLQSLVSGSAQSPPTAPAGDPVHPAMLVQFDEVKDLGVLPIYSRGQIYRWVQLFECRNLH